LRVSIVARLAKRLEVGLIERQFDIAPMRFDVVDRIGCG
jgi:hypothetical protein